MKLTKKLQAKKLQARRIGIDARFFGPKDKGLGRYTENLITNLEKIDRTNQYFIFLRKTRWNEYEPKSPNFKKILINHLYKHKLDLMHFTYFKVPIFYLASWVRLVGPFRGKGKFVLTIHDLILTHVSLLKRLAYKIIFSLALKKAEKIIAVSQHTKNDILRHYKINPSKIKVIYEGVTH